MLTHLPFQIGGYTREFHYDNWYPHERLNGYTHTWEYGGSKAIPCSFGSTLEIEITAKITRHDRVTSGYATELNELPKTAEERYKYKRNISGEFFMVFDVDPLKKLGI